MTTEEIEKAAIEYTSNLRVELNKEMAASWFFIGAMYSNTNWQEKTRWIPIKERLPELKKEPYCVLIKWGEDNDDNIDIVHIYDQREIDYMLLVKCKYWKEIE